MIFIVEGRVGRQTGFAKLFDFVVTGIVIDPTMAGQNAVRVRVDYKSWAACRVEQDRVRSFRPNAVDCEQLLAEFGKTNGEHGIQLTAVFFDYEFEQIPQPSSFDLEVAGRTY